MDLILLEVLQQVRPVITKLIVLIDNYVAWNWKAGNATLASNAFTQGSLASTCSRNVDAGFSIVSWTGNDQTGTIGHGLSKAPELILLKARNIVKNWVVYHASNTSAPETDFLTLIQQQLQRTSICGKIQHLPLLSLV